MNKFFEWCDRILRFYFYGLIFFLPISLAVSECFATSVITLFFIKRGVIFFLHFKSALRQKQPFFPAFLKEFLLFFKPVDCQINGPVGMLILVGFLSIFVSQYPHLSIKGFFCKLLEWVLLFFIFVEYINHRRYLTNFITVFLITAAIISFDGIFQYFVGADFIRFNRINPFDRATASMRHANDFGSYLVMVCLILVSLLVFYFQEEKKEILKNGRSVWAVFSIRNVSLFILFFLVVVALGLTYSRGAWLSFFLGLIFLSIYKRKVFFFIAVILFLFGVVFFPRMEQNRKVSFATDAVVTKGQNTNTEQSPFLDSPEGMTLPDGAFSWQRMLGRFVDFTGSGRRKFWLEAILVIQQAPILGSGINTYSQVAPKYKISWGGYPHNCYLQLTAEMGLLGLFALLWMIVALFRRSWRNLRTMKDDYLSFLTIGALGSLLGFWAQSFVDTNLYSIQLANLMGLTMGIAMAAQRIDREQRKA